LCICDQQNSDPIGLNDLPGYGRKMSGIYNFMNFKNQREDSEAHPTPVMPFIKFDKTGIDFCIFNAVKLSVQISITSGQNAALQ
jgi:hypothetical protein